MPLIDALKGIAAQLIVLHHLASYGALARAAEQFAPQTIDWLYGYGRIVVQVFLVVAGFLAARGLAPQGTPAVIQPAGMIWQRYVRLIVPFLFAVAIAVVSAALARVWMQDEFIPALPNIWQFLAHGLLLNGALGVPSLSAGIWYVAIDLQLYALLVLLLWLASRFSADGVIRGRVALALVAVLAGFALFFQQEPGLRFVGPVFLWFICLGGICLLGLAAETDARVDAVDDCTDDSRSSGGFSSAYRGCADGCAASRHGKIHGLAGTLAFFIPAGISGADFLFGFPHSFPRLPAHECCIREVSRWNG